MLRRPSGLWVPDYAERRFCHMSSGLGSGLSELSLSSGTRGATGGGAAYVGPGDVVAAAIGWWGLRGYTAAYSTGSNPAMDVTKASDGSVDTTINILSNGTLDVATIAGLGYAVKVKKLYDQTGGGVHLTQATLAAMPDLASNTIGVRPAMQFAAANNQTLVNAVGIARAQPFVASFVSERTGNTAAFNSVYASSTHCSAGYSNAANTAFIFGGSGVGIAAANDNAFHAIQALFSGASSTLYIDGSSTAAAAAGADAASGQLNLVDVAAGNKLTGFVSEFGLWGSDITASFSALDSNQRAYWGF